MTSQIISNTPEMRLSSDLSAESPAEPSHIDTEKIGSPEGRDVTPKPEQASVPSNRNTFRWVISCAGLYMMTFLNGLDNTIVADLQGDIVAEFGEIEKLGWLGTGYSLGAVATVFLQTKGYGLFDMKWLFIGSVVMFEAGSALCGGAPSMNAMIFGRIWAGAGGAGMYLGMLNIVSFSTSPKERALYLAVSGLTYGSGCVLGPVIGGAFSNSGASWRWAFYLNLVIGGVFAPGFFLLNSIKLAPGRSVGDKLKTMDWAGALLHAATFVFFIVAFTFGGAEWAWNAGGTIAFIVLFVATLVIYIVQQKLAILTSPETRLFPVDLLKSRTMWLLFIGTACGVTAFFIPLYYIPLYYEFVHGATGLQSAVRLLPLIFTYIVVLLVNGALLPVLGYYMPWYVAASIFQVSAGAAYYACVGVDTTDATLYGISVLAGLGGSLAQQGSYSIATTKVGMQRVADAVGFINMAQFGSTMIVLTIASAVFQNVGYRKLQDALAGQGFTSDDIHAALAGPRSQIFQTAGPEIKALALNAIVEAIRYGFVLLIAAGALGLICSLLMRWEKLDDKTKE